MTTREAVAGGAAGLAGSVLPTIVGPAVWVEVLGHAAPLFPCGPPTIITLPLGFTACWAVSVTGHSQQAGRDQAGFVVQFPDDALAAGAE